jgi:hypothetical protein
MRGNIILVIALLALLTSCGGASMRLAPETAGTVSSVAGNQAAGGYSYSLQSGETADWHWPWQWQAPSDSGNYITGRGSVVVGEAGVPIGGAGGD